MKNLVFTLLTVLTCASAHASDVSASDMDKVTNYFSQFVVKTVRPYTIYSWFNANGRDPIWRTQLSPDDQSGYAHFESNVGRYFQYECPPAGADMNQISPALNTANCRPQGQQDPGAQNLYGPGLYAAVDPFLTYQSYGGGDGYVLMQIQLPTGYRMIDAAVATQMMAASPPDSETQSILVNAACPAMGDMSQYLNPAFFHGQTCSYMMREVLRRLKIGAFAYGYNSAQGTLGCNPTYSIDQSLPYSGAFTNRAFVFISDIGMPQQNIKIFNAQSGNTLNPAARVNDPNNFDYVDRYEINNVIAYVSLNGINAPAPWADTKVLEDAATSARRATAYTMANSYGCQAGVSPVVRAQ